MEEKQNPQQEQFKIDVKQSGPYIVSGTVLITDKDGTETEKKGITALCRCGESKNKPYCDGSHKAVEFDN